jgi:hypothetical protein
MARKSRAKWRVGPPIQTLAALDGYVRVCERRGELAMVYMNRKDSRPLSWGWVQNLQIRLVRNKIAVGRMWYAIRRERSTS